MSIRRDIKDTFFYKELSKDKQKQYFDAKANKFLPAIDNIYYNLFIYGDYNGNSKLEGLFKELEQLKNRVSSEHEPQPFNKNLNLDMGVHSIYKYRLTNSDLYDIFLTDYLPNGDTPRVHVQLNAYGLWTESTEKMLLDSYTEVINIFNPLGCNFSKSIENRIDYAYHTNEIHNPEKIFVENKLVCEMRTTMKRWHKTGRIEREEDRLALKNDYIALGNRKSNNVFIRIYNKGLEVVDKGYKGFFIEHWYQNGLINFYDKYCLDKAYVEKNFDYIHKAKLEFYLENGTDNNTKALIKTLLDDHKVTLEQIKETAKALMPQLTTVMNIEYQTMRKFYYPSDDFIDSLLEAKERENASDILERLYKIIDNRKIFTEYLTSTTLSFRKKGSEEYLSWWARLKNTKQDCLITDKELLRQYSRDLDDRMSKLKFINSLATNAIYNNNLNTNIAEDIETMMASLNENDKQMLYQYSGKKKLKNEKLKNRKKDRLDKITKQSSNIK